MHNTISDNDPFIGLKLRIIGSQPAIHSHKLKFICKGISILLLDYRARYRKLINILCLIFTNNIINQPLQ